MMPTEHTDKLVSRFSRWHTVRRCTVSAFAALGVLASLTGCGQSGPLTGSAAVTQAASVSRVGRTRVIYVRPTTNDGKLKPGFTIIKRARATCPQLSVLVPGYSCVVGGESSELCIYTCHTEGGFYESCWPGGPERSARVVYCMFMPWLRHVAALTLEHPLRTISFRSKPAPKLRGDPWGVQLAGGLRCVKSSAKPEELNGIPARYSCEHNAVLVGKVMKKTEPWRAQEAYVNLHARTPQSDLTAGPVVDVSVAWYGVANAR